MRLINADELKEWIEAWFDMNKYYHPYSKRETIPTVELFDILDRIPTVDPVKHGRWKPWDLTWGRSIYYCTSCGDGCEVPTEMGKPIFDYCPHYGARMDGESNEID